MDINTLSRVMRCVECGSARLVLNDAESFDCKNCGRVFRANDGIFDLRPQQSALPLPAMYGDEALTKWSASLANNQDYLYREKSLVGWIHRSGHERIRSH